MSWELAYFCGLLSGAALAGLVGVFLHARSWADWSEAFDAMEATGWDWHNRFGAESKRAATLDTQLATLTDDLAGCRRHNAEADKEVMGLTESMAATCELLHASRAGADGRCRSLTHDRDRAVALADAIRTECESLRSQLADTRLSLDAAMSHVEQLLVKRDAGIVERDSLLAQVRGLHEAVQAVTDERNDAAARADDAAVRAAQVDRWCKTAQLDRASARTRLADVARAVELAVKGES